jgi:hypothetical protein
MFSLGAETLHTADKAKTAKQRMTQRKLLGKGYISKCKHNF